MSGRRFGGGMSRPSTLAFAAGVRRRYATCATIMCPVSCHASAPARVVTSSARMMKPLQIKRIVLLLRKKVRAVGEPSAAPVGLFVEQRAGAGAAEVGELRLPRPLDRLGLVGAPDALERLFVDEEAPVVLDLPVVRVEPPQGDGHLQPRPHGP